MILMSDKAIGDLAKLGAGSFAYKRWNIMPRRLLHQCSIFALDVFPRLGRVTTNLRLARGTETAAGVLRIGRRPPNDQVDAIPNRVLGV